MIEDVKYWAGISDADGSFNVTFSKRSDDKYYTQVSFNLYQKNPYILEKFNKHFNVNINTCNSQGVKVVRLVGNKARTYMNQVLPYLVIKKPLVEFLLSVDRKFFTAKSKKELVSKIKDIRYSNVPPMNTISDQWAAGFIDGDGSFSCNYKKNTGSLGFVISCVSHKDQNIGLISLRDKYGGSISEDSNCNRWRLSLSDKNINVLQTLGESIKIKIPQYEYILSVLKEGSHKKRLGATSESNLLIKNKLQSLNQGNTGRVYDG